MTDIQMADISEFQGSFDAGAYLNGGYECVIIRTFNGSRPDKMLPGRRDYVRGYPFCAVGYYCYLESDIDPATQAQGFIASVGTLKPNEFAILDHEEGSGNQTSRAQRWFSVVDPWAGCRAMLYSGASFLSSNLGGADSWGNRPIWIASYPGSHTPTPSSEPKAKHLLWQYTDRGNFPGLSGGVDGSIAHCSANDFLKACRPGATPAPTPPPGDQDLLVSVVKQNGCIEVFAERASNGEVLHTWQQAKDDGWCGSGPGTNAVWHSMGKPGA